MCRRRAAITALQRGIAGRALLNGTARPECDGILAALSADVIDFGGWTRGTRRSRQMAGWPLPACLMGYKPSGSTETRCRITSGEGNLRDSATEKSQPTDRKIAAMVKRCGKSAHAGFRQRNRHGNPTGNKTK